MKRAGYLIACLALAACGNQEQHQDLRQWMKESTKDLKGGVPPLPQIKPFPEIAYETANLVDPFRPSKIEPQKRAGSGGGIQPDLNRRREALEAYPLESLKMVGTLIQSKRAHALILADKNVHQVRVGNYMGQNFGIVTKISDEEVTLRELVADSLGEYSERSSTLKLQESRQEGRK
jgi:type IV pilus assembly protein PilP